jgi:hypothetical protein
MASSALERIIGGTSIPRAFAVFNHQLELGRLPPVAAAQSYRAAGAPPPWPVVLGSEMLLLGPVAVLTGALLSP